MKDSSNENGRRSIHRYLRMLTKKNFKQPTEPKGEKLGAQDMTCYNVGAAANNFNAQSIPLGPKVCALKQQTIKHGWIVSSALAPGHEEWRCLNCGTGRVENALIVGQEECRMS